jgi:hypothetical protein
MESIKHSSHPAKPLITQAKNNTTLWIGHLHTDPRDHFAGQTFTCPSGGTLDNIQVYSSAVQYPGQVQLTLHEFDPVAKTWGSSIGQSSLAIDKNDNSKWIRFALPAIQLRQGMTYGFRLHAVDAMIGLGEAVTGTQQPFTGHEWSADSTNQKGHFYSYFSLAFKVECA